jgi:hypothetical protein
MPAARRCCRAACGDDWPSPEPVARLAQRPGGRPAEPCRYWAEDAPEDRRQCFAGIQAHQHAAELHEAVGPLAAAAGAWGNPECAVQDRRGQHAGDHPGVQPLDSGLGGADDCHALTPLATGRQDCQYRRWDQRIPYLNGLDPNIALIRR